MGMYLIEKGTDCIVENVRTNNKKRHRTKKTNVFWKEELKWSRGNQLCFQHLDREEGHPDYRLIVDKKHVKYG